MDYIQVVQCILLFVSIFSCCFARDIIEFGVPIKDNGETLVSAGQTFELGFFSKSGGRYVGIWYKFSNNTVVWVANRDNPVQGTHGVFRINDGNLQVWDESRGISYWSVPEIRSPTNLTAKLMDSGNLVLGDTVWESFKNPTDTFLPGMDMTADLKLTSWRGKDDPALGSFSFQLDGQEDEDQYIIKNTSTPYWRSGGKFASSNMIADGIAYMLSNFTRGSKSNQSQSRDHNSKMLVLLYNGTIASYGNNSDLMWFEPADHCSIVNACGTFGSCNAHSRQRCKCLPGFKPGYLEHWGSGDFSGGCNPKGTEPCGTTFLNLTMMNLRKPNTVETGVRYEEQCKQICLNSCPCLAYSFQPSEERVPPKRVSNLSSSTCSIWNEVLYDVQEKYADGKNLSVRVAVSDLESTKKNCGPCGSNIIPYPLSTGPDCGDPMYSSFRCDLHDDTVFFKIPPEEYKVITINPENLTFHIETKFSENCAARRLPGKILLLNQSLQFNLTGRCYTIPGDLGFGASSGRTSEVEIQWYPPHEPVCSSDSDCKEWPSTSCSHAATSDGEKRCLCYTDFKWDGLKLNCTRKIQEREDTTLLPVVVPTVLSAVALVCASVWFIIWRRKKLKKQEKKRSDQRSKELLKLDTQTRISHLMNSGEFVQEDEEGIDVPFFDFETIMAATDEFSDENKLGQGGYGPVYKGTFQGEQKMAVKRLSSVSGQGLQEFKNEVVLIAKLQHRNLVRLRGYCIKGDEKILLYEYMPNRSLDSFIFYEEQSMLLDWNKRFNIIIGVARGLLYLHQDSRLRIIHRDLKTSNILLDQDMEPKISDFGLARIVGGKQTEANTERVVGTYGYMSPEYALEGVFSVKSDVFSFGVVLLEIISGKRTTRPVLLERPLSLLGYVWRLWTENKVFDLTDPALRESCKDEQFLKCVKIALLCVQEDPSKRPTMSAIVTILDSESEAVPDPQEPAFVLKTGTGMASSSSSTIIPEITATLEVGR